MNSGEYHSLDSAIQACRFCGVAWGDHEETCAMTAPDSWDADPAARGREEDRTYADLRERGEEWGR